MRVGKRMGLCATAALLAGMVGVGRGMAVEEAKAPGSLEALGMLVGGYWHIEPGKKMNAYHSFEWGPNKRALRGTFYAIPEQGGAHTVRADAFFYWDPVRKKVRAVSAGAGGEVYDGEWTQNGATWTQDFDYLSTRGKVTFRDVMHFPDADTYHWTLLRKTDEGYKEQMKATFRRVKARPTVRSATPPPG